MLDPFQCHPTDPESDGAQSSHSPPFLGTARDRSRCRRALCWQLQWCRPHDTCQALYSSRLVSVAACSGTHPHIHHRRSSVRSAPNIHPRHKSGFADAARGNQGALQGWQGSFVLSIEPATVAQVQKLNHLAPPNLPRSHCAPDPKPILRSWFNLVIITPPNI